MDDGETASLRDLKNGIARRTEKTRGDRARHKAQENDRPAQVGRTDIVGQFINCPTMSLCGATLQES